MEEKRRGLDERGKEGKVRRKSGEREEMRGRNE